MIDVGWQFLVHRRLPSFSDFLSFVEIRISYPASPWYLYLVHVSRLTGPIGKQEAFDSLLLVFLKDTS